MATKTDRPPHSPLRVVIIGAGIAGLAAALSLRRYYPPGDDDSSPVQITIYEQARELREVGASIGLNPSGLRVLGDRLGVDADAIAFRQPSGRPMVYRHWRTGEEIGHDDCGKPSEVEVEEGRRYSMARFHRAHLQRLMADALPGDVEMRLGMRVQGVQVDEAEGGVVQVSFEDGSSVAADLLIGADGIHSKVRRAFAPDHELKWTGAIAFRAAFDFSLVEDIKGLPEDAVFWVGHERSFFATRLGEGPRVPHYYNVRLVDANVEDTTGNNQYAIVGSYSCDLNNPNAPYRDGKWDGPADIEFFRALYQVEYSPLPTKQTFVAYRHRRIVERWDLDD